jgi:hypothetical protein
MLETVGCYVAEKLQSTGRVVQSDLWIGLKDFIGWLDDKMALLRVWETYVAPLKTYRGKDDVFLPFLQTLSSGTFNHFFHPQDSNPSEANQRVIQVDRRALADFAAYWERLDPDLVSLPDLWRERLLGLRESGN